MARTVLTIGGYAIGYAIGGPIGGSIGGAIGGYAGAMLTAEDTEGPRLDELGVAGGEEGAPIPQLYGTQRMTGHVIVADDLIEHEEEEDAGGKGGPTYTTFSYTLTYAVGFCDPRLGQGELRRVWSNKKLYEDYRAEAENITEGVPLDWYDGTQTEPDADLVALIGEGNVPAYTGLCYGVYKDRAMQPFGNRVPVDEAEIVSNGSPTPNLTVTEVFLDARRCYDDSSLVYSNITGKIYGMADDNTDVYIIEYNPFTRETTREIVTDAIITNDPIIGSRNGFRLKNDVFYYATGSTVYSRNLTSGLDLIGSATFTASVSALLAESEHWILGVGGTTQWRAVRKDDTVNININASGSGIATSFEQNAIGLSNNQFLVQLDPGNEFGVIDIAADGTVTWVNTETNVTYNTITSGYQGAITDKNGDHWFPVAASGGDALIRVNDAGVIQEQVEVAATITGFKSCNNKILSYDPAEHTLYWMNNTNKAMRWDIDRGTGEEFSFDTGGVLNGVTAVCSLVWHPETDRIIAWVADSTQDYHMGVIRLRTVAAGTLDLSDVIDDVCDQAGLEVSEYNTTGLTGTVVGYLVARQGPASGIVDQIMRLGLGYMTSSDWALKFSDLGGSVVDTIDANHLGTRAYGSSPVMPVETVEIPSYRVPRRWQIRYAASESSYEPGMVLVENPIGSNDLTGGDQYPAAMTQQQAADLAQKRMLLSTDKKPYKFSLPRIYSHLDPGDPITLPTNQGNKRVRITNVDRGHNGVLLINAISDNASDINAITTAPPPKVDVTIPPVGPAQLIYLDTPLLRDIDSGSNPGPYLVSFVEGAEWVGVQMQSSADSQVFNTLGGLDDESIGGRCETVPTSVSYEDYDTTNTLRVVLLTGGSLASVTDNAMLYNRANVAAWGRPGRWEIVQFGTVSLVSAGVYDVSRLLRGRRGTDGNMDTHTDGDWFVILAQSHAGVLRENLALADLGTTRYYKAVNYGSYASDAGVHERVVGSNPLKPWSPYAITGAVVGTNIEFDWVWRTRFGGVYGGTNSVTDGVPGTQQDEDTGQFRVLDSAGNILNTYSTASSSYDYSDANRTTDYTGLSTYAVYYQISQDPSTAGVTEGLWSAIQTFVLGFTVLNAAGTGFGCGKDVLDMDGNSFTVDSDVLDMDGNAFTVI